MLEETLAIGEPEAVGRLLVEARRLRMTMMHAVVLARSGPVDGAIKLLKAELARRKDE